MAQTLGYVALLVRDYDEALAFFTHSLGFTVIEDSPAKDRLGSNKRWVLSVQPVPAAPACYSPARQRPKRRAALATKPAVVSSYFSTLTISGATTIKCSREA